MIQDDEHAFQESPATAADPARDARAVADPGEDHPRPPAAPHLRRRDFLRLGALGGVTLVTAAGCDPSQAGTGSAAGAGANAAAGAPVALDEITVAELQAGMADGRWSARRVTELYLERISLLDGNANLRSILETNPDALEIADQLDRERAAGQLRGPLHGVPVLLKDNIDTADRMTTTAGSLALEGSIPPRDAYVAERLRAAGAVLLGKANMSEWANFRSTRSSSGWSARGGQCGNAYVVDRNPCGSSSGSAAAVSANLCALAVGTETSGSIVCPASVNGVVGIKPTVGLLSRSGIIPISHTQDTAGPMARTVTDAVLLLNAMLGEDPRDAATQRARGNAQADYTAFLSADGVRGARIGVERSYFGLHPDVDAAMERALSTLSGLGATIVDPANIPTRVRSAELALQVMLWEFKTGLAEYLATLGPNAPVKTLADVIAFNERNAEREMPIFGQELFLQSEAKGPLTDPEYLRVREEARRLSQDEGIDLVMNQHQLDAIVAPSTRPAWKIDHVHGGLTSGSSAAPAATAAYPNVTLPVGSSFGLPFGISFFGRAWSEPTLIRLAFAFEQASLERTRPGLLPSIELARS